MAASAFVRRHNRCFSENGKILKCSPSPSATRPITRAPAGTRPSTENKWSQRRCQHYVRLYKCDAQGDPVRTRHLKATGIAGSRSIQTSLMNKNTGNAYRQQEIHQQSSSFISTSAAEACCFPAFLAANIINDTL